MLHAEPLGRTADAGREGKTAGGRRMASAYLSVREKQSQALLGRRL